MVLKEKINSLYSSIKYKTFIEGKAKKIKNNTGKKVQINSKSWLSVLKESKDIVNILKNMK